MVSLAPSIARSDLTSAEAARPRKTAEQYEESVTELARRLRSGTAFHLGGYAFVELRMPGADQLPRAVVAAAFFGFVALRIAGLFLALRKSGSVGQRLGLMAAGSIGASVVWGVRTAAVQFHTGPSEQSLLMLVIMCGLSTGAMIAFAPSLWVQRATQSAMFVPILIAGFFGGGSFSLALLHAMFYIYIVARGSGAHREYWDSVRTTELLRRHAQSAQRAAAAADDANRQLRAEITYGAKMEIELRQAQKLEAIGRLAAGIAHEINTPLQFVTDSCLFLGDGVADLSAGLDDYRRLVDDVVAGRVGPGDVADATARIDRERDVVYLRDNLSEAVGLALHGLERVGKIVAATKDYAHPRTEKAYADLNKGIESTLIMSSNETKYVADVVTDLGELPPVMCHIGEVNQAVLAIVINAAHAIGDVVKHTGGKGTIRIETWAEPGRVRIAITDTGTGIPVEILDKIYEPFFTTKPVGMGSGQGLASARSAIVNKHGGTIDVRSELGAGSTFTISLPVS